MVQRLRKEEGHAIYPSPFEEEGRAIYPSPLEGEGRVGGETAKT